jgi:hypothetical protein
VRIASPETATWGATEQLLAAAVDALRWLQWAQTKEAQKPGARGPDPIERPGVKPKKASHGGDVLSIEEFERRMTEKRRRAQAR